MKIFRRYMHNNLRNYNYLIGCERTQEAIAIDPLDGEQMLQLAQQQGLKIKMVINTHEHHDHIEGNPTIVAATGAQVLSHQNAMERIPNVDRGLQAGDLVTLGDIRLRVLFTPGHTPVHLCILGLREENSNMTQDVLFSGDTLFNACAGNCSKGGDVDDMYDSFVSQLMPLPDETLLYPGHEYMKNNLAFALSREPSNQTAKDWQAKVDALTPDDMPYMTLGQERQYNPFLRLHEARIIEGLKKEYQNLGQGDRDVFKALRKLRDQW
ncbi:MAG: hydroxyacylglutathione hydrolase [Oleibacter sp.]|nr:hydroxyacylglutathione hydrolase [Thalassolituus sp.]